MAVGVVTELNNNCVILNIIILKTSGKRKLNSLLRILCNPSLSLYLRRQVILSILRPSLEYGNEVWRCTSTQSKALDAVLLGAC